MPCAADGFITTNGDGAVTSHHTETSIGQMDRASIDYVLTTTRNVRKRLDLTRAVPLELIEECIDLAVQAPTGCNAQTWRFLVVTDPEKREKLAESYASRRSDSSGLQMLGRLGLSIPQSGVTSDPTLDEKNRVIDSAAYLSQHLGEVPVLIIACIEGRLESNHNFVSSSFYGSILPATWSLMLALRSRGLVSAWTTVHLENEELAAEVLGIPLGVTQVALLPVAYPIGQSFHPAPRRPARDVTYLNTWGVKL